MTALAEIVGRTVPLTRRGRRWIGRCPWHADRQPSFAVWSHEGQDFAGCWVCARTLNAIGWLCEMEGMSFADAKRALNGSEWRPDPGREAERRAAEHAAGARERRMQRLLYRNPDFPSDGEAFLRARPDERIKEWI